eukprot:CAMPEP_0185200458 /NCGR_PEP_ID=MMETSP1140-20130426/47314_1 /TAXON_ID=298111 /ORGANISM="Pavlova sp., Strain CCMP459" /LENGTH=85 /DNA_ID=CAMNT_0027767797 /DNA_START=587 /DNA_END=844 /DNA_ORIENTATION=-
MTHLHPEAITAVLQQQLRLVQLRLEKGPSAQARWLSTSKVMFPCRTALQLKEGLYCGRSGRPRGWISTGPAGVRRVRADQCQWTV